jgi:hypothetical protein
MGDEGENMAPKFSKGDWLLFEHGIHQVQKTDGDRITDLSDGSFSIGGYDFSDRVYPLTLAGKNCADWFDYYYHDLHREQGSNKLNWPDLHRHITDLWAQTMDVIGDESKTKAAYDKAQTFFGEVTDKLRDIRQTETAGGLKLFR